MSRPTTTTTTIDEIPAHFECNPHVVGGYRPVGMSWAWYAKSTLSWHNETVNAATMFVGLVFFLDALERAVGRWYAGDACCGDAFSLVVFRACTTMMFACSTAYHAFWPRGRRAYELLLRLDHACIVLCVGSYAFPTAAIVSGSSTFATRAYWIAATVVTARNVALVTTRRLDTTTRLRATVGTAWFVPVLYAHCRSLPTSDVDASSSSTSEAYRRVIVAGILYPIGALAYATRFPDRLRPGWFDHVGSHEFMHACVLFGALFHSALFERALSR